MWFDLLVVIGLLVGGGITGIAAGLFGVGGGTVLVPLLLTLFDCFNVPASIEMSVTVATSLTLLVLTAVSSSLSQHRRGNLDLVMAKRWIPGICLGSVLGAYLLPYVSSFGLKLFFLAYLIFCIIFSLLESPNRQERTDYPSTVLLFLLSLVVSTCSTLLGIGGGAFTTPILNFLRYTFRKALAISSLTGLFIGGIGAVIVVVNSIGKPGLPRFSIGYVNYLVVILIGPASMLGSVQGVRLAARLSRQHLKRAYTVFLILITLLMLSHVV